MADKTDIKTENHDLSINGSPVTPERIDAAEYMAHVTMGSSNKLDADLYNVEDADAITESMFGSGNLNYLTLQSQQDDLMGNSRGGDFTPGQDISLAGLGSGLSSGHGVSSLAQVAGHATPDGVDETSQPVSFVDVSEAAKTANIQDGESGRAGETQTISTSTDDAALSLLSSNTNTRTGRNGGDGINGTSGSNGLPTNGNNGSNGANGDDGFNGNDGRDGRDGTNPNPPNDPPGNGDNDTDLHIDLGNADLGVAQVVDVLLDPVEAIVGDIDVNIIGDTDLANGSVDLHIDSIVAGAPLLNLDVPVSIPALGALVQAVQGGGLLENPVQSVLGGAQSAVDLVEGLTNNLLAGIEQSPLGEILPDAVTDLVGQALTGVTDVATNLLQNETLDAVADAVDNLVSVEDLMQDPVQALGDVVANAGDGLDSVLDNLGSGPLGDVLPEQLTDGLDALGDGIETLTQAVPVDAILQPVVNIVEPLVENLIDVAQDASGILTDGLNNLTSQLSPEQADGLFDTLGLSAPDQDGDTDLQIDLGLAGPVEANPVVDVILDPVEAITGDIDINIAPDINLEATDAIAQTLIDTVTDVLSGDIDAQNIASDLTTLTETTVEDLGNILSGDTVLIGDDGIVSGEIDVLAGPLDLPAIDIGELDSLIESLPDTLVGDNTLVDALTGGGDTPLWPEAPLEAGDLLGSVLGSGDGETAGILADPIASVGEGLGLLDVVNNTSGNSGAQGGHFGSLFGGLFG